MNYLIKMPGRIPIRSYFRFCERCGKKYYATGRRSKYCVKCYKPRTGNSVPPYTLIRKIEKMTKKLNIIQYEYLWKYCKNCKRYGVHIKIKRKLYCMVCETYG